MQTRLTILCENSVGVPFDVLGEHGFACFIETAEGNYLFDTGQGYTIVGNALALDKELRSIRAVMISHGHYDHTGGLPAVLRQRGTVDVFGHENMFSRRIWSKDGSERDIGIPFRRAYLESLGARFRLGRELVEVGPGVFLSGEIPRTSSFELGDPNMTRINDDGTQVHPDPLDDDLSLVVRTGRGLVLILGCAHAGMINILEHVTTRFPGERIYAVIGGTHLGFSSDEQFEATLARIDEYGIERIGVSHCTGLEKAAMLHARLGERFFFGTVGAVLEG
jgi:7,8-dihydropterin-6-yl-methyl-4-(beta-D-ribofuranosyl)aminobenzene 5'-phosphate synthase